MLPRGELAAAEEADDDLGDDPQETMYQLEAGSI
jgi:hypothetical protein